MSKDIVSSIFEQAGKELTGSEYSYQNILEASDLVELNEASLGRVLQHLSGRSVKSWCLVTSWRSDLPPSENNRRIVDLRKLVKSWDLGFFDVKGHGQEDSDDGTKIVSKERALFIPGISYKKALEIAVRYDQDWFIYCGPEIDGEVKAFRKDGSVAQEFKDFHPMQISKFYTVVKGHPFFFECLPVNIGEMQARDSVGGSKALRKVGK